MRQNCVAQFLQLLKCWLCDVQSGIVVEKNWASSVDQWQLQALQFLMHLIDLLSILLRCNGSTGIQKTIVDQTSIRPPNSDPDFFLALGNDGFGSALEVLLSPASYCIKSSFRPVSQSNQEMVRCSCVE